MKIRDIFAISLNIQNIVVEIRKNGRLIRTYELGEHAAPSKYMRLIDETAEGDRYSMEYFQSKDTPDYIINPAPFDEDDPGKTIPRHIMDMEISRMKPWNVFQIDSDRYQYKFVCDIGDREIPVPKRKRGKNDDGQMSLNLEE